MPTTTAESPGTRAVRPFRDGLVALDPPRLLGSRCAACGTTAFPPREFCPSCRAVEHIDKAELATAGRIHSFTIVRQAPPGMPVPYVLAWVDLPDDGVRLLTTVVGTQPEEVELDQPVELELTPFGTADDGASLMGFRFRVTTRGETR
ncbi:Zn-ribbon domain-containing OB-fold protein [Prauserella muralis]|uniref:Uncharacterized protein n=1 Tax=Prauserella muralis TaxID=588067 RepID=A0A2V4AGV8_9PSEU|nr:OB-fold domain-containing protein [Prauserella muralis]PXY18941.1 hypothetical protein BAY60_29380 [Prauserella muralis]TWE28823.1 hypothetical protein FHX69_1488 [Prauserella muralis]